MPKTGIRPEEVQRQLVSVLQMEEPFIPAIIDFGQAKEAEGKSIGFHHAPGKDDIPFLVSRFKTREHGLTPPVLLPMLDLHLWYRRQPSSPIMIERHLLTMTKS